MDDRELSELSPDQPKSILGRFRSIITIEPAVFFCTLGWGFQMIISQNLMIDKVCRVNLNISQEICDNLTYYNASEKEVQVVTANLGMYQSILTAIPAIITSLFLGPWSDTNGRKPLMISPMFGTILNQAIYIINTYFTSLPAEYLLFASVGSVFGGFTSFLVGMYGFISDISEIRARTSRIALLDFAIFFGFPIGTFASGPVFSYGGYYAVFSLAAISTFIGMLYIIFFIKDTRGPYSDQETNQSGHFCDVFSIINVIEVFKTCFKRRAGYIRGIILFLILTMLFNLATFEASSLIYLFARLRLNWTEQDYTEWTAVSSVSTSFATFGILAILSYRLKIHDALIGMLGAFTGIFAKLILAFANYSWMMYLATFVGMISTTPAITVRAYLSKVTPKEEIGAIFSLVAALEAAIPLVISPFMTYVYNHTINVFPGAIMILQAGINLLSMMTLFSVYVMSKKSFDINDDNQQIIDNEDTSSESENE